ncbi:hypothetical protein Lesp01_90270 [Lentzea sp. NBRC 102530]|nr:hypothetical protein Lesp01_90270 [Lentzea sp. NBRC 102530]
MAPITVPMTGMLSVEWAVRVRNTVALLVDGATAAARFGCTWWRLAGTTPVPHDATTRGRMCAGEGRMNA